MSEIAVPPPLVVGFDLDMTLIDTVPGFVATLDRLGAELGVELPAVALSSNLGPPLEQLLAPYLPADQVGPAGDLFRAIYPETAVHSVPALPGAHDALAAVRRERGRTVVVTGKYPANAQRHLDHLALDVDVLEGWVWGIGKAEALVREGASIYVGDHVHDVEGALAAGVLSVSVTTGGSTAEELRAAGTHVVLGSLEEFPAWLAEHLLTTRLAALEADLRSRGSVLVSYSGGADSAFLLAAAVRALGPGRVLAATGYSDSLPQAERDPARDFAASLGVEVVTPQTHEMDREGYRANGADRCFFCKAELVEVLTPIAAAHGLAVVATGTNADDAVAGFRPGIRAADERGAVAPLRDAGLTKAQVREASHRWGLPTWDKPAAACLSSRIAYGIEVSPHRLARVERAEAAARRLLTSYDVRDLRVRDLGDRASVEVDAALLPLDPHLESALVSAVRAAGFEAAEVDPRGLPVGLDERARGVSALDAAAVLAAAAAWVYVPEDAREVRTDDVHLVAYPPHWADPTAAWVATSRPAAEVVDEVLAAAADLGRHEVLFWAHEDTRPAGLVEHLLARGATVHEELAVLARTLDELPDLDVPDGFEVRPATDLDTQRDHDRIGVEVFGGTVRDDDELAAGLARSTPDDGVGLVAYRDGEAMATGGFSVAGGVLRLWGGATLPHARGTGAYRAVLARRLEIGVEQGCRLALVKGRLTTSAPILRRAGFEVFGAETAYRLA